MRIDWSTAKVAPARSGDHLTLRVQIVDVRGGKAYETAFEREASRWRASLGTERRDVHRYSGSSLVGESSEWGIELWPIEPANVDMDRRLLEEFVEQIERTARPQQDALDAGSHRRPAHAEELQAQARVLTDRFRSGG